MWKININFSSFFHFPHKTNATKNAITPTEKANLNPDLAGVGFDWTANWKLHYDPLELVKYPLTLPAPADVN